MHVRPSFDPFKRRKTRHRGITYRVRADGSHHYYVYAQGRQHPVLGGEQEAVAKQAELRGKTARGERIPRANIRFRDMAEAWLASKHRLRPWTRKQYRAALDNELLPRFGHLKLAQIDAERVAHLIRELEARGLSCSTISSYLLPLSGTLSLAVRRGHIAVNPCALLTVDERPARVERKKVHEWSEDEIVALLAASESLGKRAESRFSYAPLLRTAVHTGLRLGELLGLQWRDIDFDEAVLHVHQQLTRQGDLAPPKTAKARRRVPLTPEIAAFLREHKIASRHSQDEDFIFASRTGGPLSHRNVQRRGLEAARDLAGLPKEITFHDLRHAFASFAAHRGVPVGVLSEILGHTNVGVTQRVYIHLFDRQAAEDAFRTAMASKGAGGPL